MITEFNGWPVGKYHPINNSRGALFDVVCREMVKPAGIYYAFRAGGNSIPVLLYDSILARPRTGSDYEPHMKINGGRIAL